MHEDVAAALRILGRSFRGDPGETSGDPLDPP
jgi:hypothetical protein